MLRHTRHVVLGAALGAALLGGGCFAGSAHCDFREAQNPRPRCQERLDTLDTAGFKAICATAQGNARDGACPRDGIVAGCDIGAQGDGSRVVDWYYAPKTVADVMSDCAGDKGTFLAKP